MTDPDPTSELRAWAYGSNGREAATELLIRAGLANVNDPWVRHDPQWGIYAVDYTAVPYGRPGLTNSQKAVLLLAASLADNTLIDLHAVSRELDYDHTRLVLTAITHAASYHRPSSGVEKRTADSAVPQIVRRPPLMTWDDDDSN